MPIVNHRMYHNDRIVAEPHVLFTHRSFTHRSFTHRSFTHRSFTHRSCIESDITTRFGLCHRCFDNVVRYSVGIAMKWSVCT